MATVMTAGKGVRSAARKLERPRPLKQTSIDLSCEKPNVTSPIIENTIAKSSNMLVQEDVIKELGVLNLTITNGNYDLNTNTAVVKLCSQLKFWGQQLEDKYKDQLDRYFETLRNASRSELLGLHARTHLLEVIELRAKGWKNDQNLESYYKQKLSDISNMQSGGYYGSSSALMNSATLPASFTPGQQLIMSPTHVLSHSNSQATLSPGEVLKNSGKFPYPTKIPGKSFVKDEVVIRNSDSGKVMGIKGRRVHMIEELSETVISFQRVGPGTKDRLVQIIGPQADNIDQAKVLIEETIRRNASPIREVPEMVIAGLVASDSSNSLNSTASEESLSNNRMHQHNLQSVLYSGQQVGSNFTDLANRRELDSKKKLLIHSHSMSDTTIGEYAHTISVGLNVLKISGFNADLVTKAKQVLEQYFEGEAEREKKQREHEAMMAASLIKTPIPVKVTPKTTHQVIFSTNNTSWGVAQKAPIKQDSYSSNGSGSNGLLPSSSSEEDTTVKAGESSPDEENNTTRPPQTGALKKSTSFLGTRHSSQSIVGHTGCQTVMVVRQPIFPSSKLEEIQKTEKYTDAATLGANKRRANFSQKNSSGDSSSSSKEDIPPVPSQDKHLRNRSKSSPDMEYSIGVPKVANGTLICYSRQELLECAKNPLCKMLPAQQENFLELAQTQAILKLEPIKYFDPITYPAPGVSSTPRWKPSVSPPKSESFDGGL